MDQEYQALVSMVDDPGTPGLQRKLARRLLTAFDRHIERWTRFGGGISQNQHELNRYYEKTYRLESEAWRLMGK